MRRNSDHNRWQYYRRLLLVTPISLSFAGCQVRSMSLLNGPPSKSATSPNAVASVTPPASSKPAAKPPTQSKPAQTQSKGMPKLASVHYQKSLDRADSARSISQSATNPDDWKLAASRWQQAIKLLRQVPKSDVNHKYVAKHLAAFQQGLEMAQVRSQGRKIQGTLKPAISSTKRIEPVDLIAPAGSNSRNFQVPIRARRDRIPVIDVSFNGGRRFPMMVDTGASGTMITQAMADSLGIEEAGSAAIMTPAGRSSTGYGFVGQINVGSKSIYNVPVTIGPVALLGHDFFGDCDVAFRQDVIEFSNCSV
ncbi:retropepsin-like aspartic protease [Romeriopsis navalis]|uniref:retropepsin-like aspartic protease n=1 Tax=Romeriopsis navalis TaxID=2992132 RepID=UPI0021F84844|nr:retropepsin-like aspartic protease [Romeriopsis navalis]